jgi:hypothetical protein
MQTWADTQKDSLIQRYPGWESWYVPRYPVGYTWHARPWGAPAATIYAESPEDLEQQIRRHQASGLPG